MLHRKSILHDYLTKFFHCLLLAFYHIVTSITSLSYKDYPSFLVNSFQPTAAFHMETIHLICSSNQMTAFYMKRKTRLK